MCCVLVLLWADCQSSTINQITKLTAAHTKNTLHIKHCKLHTACWTLKTAHCILQTCLAISFGIYSLPTSWNMGQLTGGADETGCFQTTGKINGCTGYYNCISMNWFSKKDKSQVKSLIDPWHHALLEFNFSVQGDQHDLVWVWARVIQPHLLTAALIYCIKQQ